ncbi:hypothetical protein HBI04_152690 [Parastagonospora nodorum]|nr:hypothetical protein HBH43_145020 [Parastagonospora nodorum]KAH4256989.1 hypothetical protein HBI03_157690 [Parastagonospora nodorum]KAH4269890.1 hypothetical protein HBI04_152690 [Parastagonospora nodorum]KAH5507188.1 hypothetical protein HBI52_144810 [Parastagonospora nodorum]KAH6203275.1 hypothetical protein HBI53_141010 [Parastagonospora nodorum]
MSASSNTTSTSQHADTNSTTTPLIRESKPAEDNSLLAKGKRKILGLGKKHEAAEDKSASGKAGATQRTKSPTSAPTLLPSPPLTDQRTSPRGSPRIRPVGIGASPNRRSMHRSTSPGLHSPASSAIFERNVQEPEDSSAIPAHIKTEDHIPPALDASSLAITDDHLNPDEVEIVMHSAHQPAASAVAGGATDSVYSPSLAHEESMASSHADVNEPTSNYGSLDMTDPRRLSFISFADVVQAEHVEQDREMLGSSDALQFQSLSSTANRSPSPVRSPASSRGMSTSPPTSGAASPGFADHGRTRSPGSPMSPSSPPLGSGEPPLQIETMRQALRKTHSGDLSGHRSQPLSAVSLEDSNAERAPFR